MVVRADSVGIRLKEIREAKQISGEGLARLLRCSQSKISKIERGAIRPRPEFVSAFCKALSLSQSQRRQLAALTADFHITFNVPTVFGFMTRTLSRWKLLPLTSISGIVEMLSSILFSLRDYARWGLVESRHALLSIQPLKI